VIELLTVLATFGALATAAVSYFKLRFLRDSLREAQRRVYLVQARLNELEQTVQHELQVLRARLRQQSGGTLVEPTMKLADAIALDPRIRDVLARFHLGGCSSCAVNEEHTIEQAARSYGVDLDRLMAAITTLSDEPEPSPKAPEGGNLLQLMEF
jgi:hybrid cluster-associated redox disulfide protein